MINVTKSYLPAREHLDKYIDRIYHSGWMTNNGQLVVELENRLKSFLNVDYVVPVANGTLALQIVYRVLGLKKEVMTTPFSFVATTSSLAWENLHPVFCDIDPETFNIDPSRLRKSLTKDTSGILPVHVFGNSCDVEVLSDFCKEHDIALIYDAAHAFNVANENRNILRYGDASILSFHASKIYHTIEGGAIIFQNEEHYRKAKLMINFGIADYDRVDILGINCKMNEFQAAMGLAVLDDFPVLNNQRQQVWEGYRSAFTDHPGVQMQKLNSGFKNNYSYFPVVFESEEILLKVKAGMNEAGIFPRRYFYPSLNNLSYLGNTVSCPVSESLSKRILCLPLYASLPESTQEQIIGLVNKNI